MATPQQGPDFKVRDNFDPVAAAQLISQKEEREQQMALKASEERRKKISGLFEAIATGQQIAQNSLKLAEQRLRREGVGEAVRVIGEKPPTASSTALPEHGQFPVQPAPGAEEDKKARLAQAMLKINPDKFLETQIPGQATASQMEQATMVVNGVPQTFIIDKLKGTVKYPDGTTPPEDVMAQLRKDGFQRGYAPENRVEGYTRDGKPVIKNRFGEFRTTDDQPYDGPVYPKLENIPAGFATALGDLDYAQTVLTRIADKYNTDFVGPVAARYGKISGYIDTLTEEERVAFYRDVAEFKNATVRAITGAQLNKDEVPRIFQQLPNENTSPKAFVEAMKQSYRAAQQQVKAKERSLARGGYATRADSAPALTEQEVADMFDKRLGKIAPKNTPKTDEDIDAALAAAQAELEALRKGKK